MGHSLEQIRVGADRLRAGGVVAFPTETVYGLGADAFSAAAVARVFALKGRPSNNPLIVHVTGRDMALRAVSAWPEEAEALTRAFWPGPLSLILPKSAAVPPGVTGGGATVAIRAPDHPAALALLFAFGGPIVGPSANPSGRVSPTTAAHVRAAFSEEDVLVLDGGPCGTGIESTVLLLPVHGGGGGGAGGGAGDQVRIVRRGTIGAGAIAAVLGRSVADGPAAGREGEDGNGGEGGAPLISPGLLGSHYAPATPAVLFGPEGWPGVLKESTGVVAVVSHVGRGVPPPHRLVRLPGDARGYARALYAALREADALEPALIAVERPPPPAPAPGADAGDAAVWGAVLDRLSRATRPYTGGR